MPGVSATYPCGDRTAGIDSSSSVLSTASVEALRTSTAGASPVTVTVSCSSPTLICTLTVAVKNAGRSIPFLTTVEKPGRVKVTLYWPGRRSFSR